MFTEDQATQLKEDYGTVTVVSWARSEADATYDWVVGRSMALTKPLAGHDSPYLCIEDTNSISRSYNKVVIVDRYGDKLTTINLTTVTTPWWDKHTVEGLDRPNKVRQTLDVRRKLAIYATEDTLAPRSKRVEPLYRPDLRIGSSDSCGYSNLASYHPDSPFTVAYKGRRKIAINTPKRKL